MGRFEEESRLERPIENSTWPDYKDTNTFSIYIYSILDACNQLIHWNIVTVDMIEMNPY